MIKIAFTSFVLFSACAASAAGINWSYSGASHYQTALVVWSDEDLGPLGVAAPKTAVTAARNEVLGLLEKGDAVKWTSLKAIGGKVRDYTYVVSDVVDPNAGETRLSHDILYARVRTGWGFSLLANLDAEGNVIEYAVNEVTSGDILSEINGITRLEIKDVDLTRHVTGYGQARIKEAGAPKIVAHEAQPTQARDADEPHVFRFDISNAVGGFTYRLASADTPTGPFVASEIGARFAVADGRLDFLIRLDPSVKRRFFKVVVGE